MKIIFFGSDDFAQAHLSHLAANSFNVIACVTQPDKARNRGMKIIVSPIKEYALLNNIKVLQPANLLDKDFVGELKSLSADIFVVIAYGKFLHKEIIDMSKFGAINVHGSYLPKYRGAAPINWAIINGEKETGISIIKINERMDAGNIIVQEKIPIVKDDTSITLRQKMIEKGKTLLVQTINDLSEDIKGIRQNEDDVSYAPKLTKEMGKIDWSKSAYQIRNMIRGLLPWPSAYTRFEGKIFKILKAAKVEISEKHCSPGEVIDINDDGITVATGDGALLVQEVHLESSKPMDIKSFLRGHNLKVGYSFIV